MRTNLDGAVHASSSPNLGVTTQAIWKTVEGLLTATINYYSQVQGYPKLTKFGITKGGTGQTGDIGFDAMFFRGIPLVKDQKCTSGRLYFLNTNNLWFAKLDHPKFSTNRNGFAWTGLVKRFKKFINNLFNLKIVPCYA